MPSPCPFMSVWPMSRVFQVSLSACRLMRSLSAVIAHPPSWMPSRTIQRVAKNDSVEDTAAFDDEKLAGHEIAVVAGKEQRGAGDVLRQLHALKGSSPRARLAPLAHLVRDLLLAHGRPGRQAIDIDAPRPELLCQHARQLDHPSLRRGVMGHVACAVEEGSRR